MKKGSHHNLETIEKLRLARGLQGATFKGKRHTDEAKEKMRQATLNNPQRFWKGKKFTKEMREKMSLAKLGKPTSAWSENRSNRYQKKLEKLAGTNRPEACEICGAIGQICFDHDHKTGGFRGWICWRCNVVLGHVKDSAELLIAIANYLNTKQNG
jgi:hypothetical protein